MAVDVTVETEIRCERESIARFAMDPTNDAQWIGALISVRVITEGPIGAGSRVERVAAFLGKRMLYVNEIVTYEPPARLLMRSVQAPFPMTVSYEFEATATGTIARIHTGGEASGFYGLATPLLSKMVRRGVARDLAKLKALLESKNHNKSQP